MNMKLCLRCGYMEGNDFPAHDPYGHDECGCPDWGVDGTPEIKIYGNAEGKCPKCHATGDDWVEGF